MAVNIQVEDLWVVIPCSVVVECERFRGPYCLQLQDWNVNTTRRHNPENLDLKLQHPFFLYVTLSAFSELLSSNNENITKNVPSPITLFKKTISATSKTCKCINTSHRFGLESGKRAAIRQCNAKCHSVSFDLCLAAVWWGLICYIINCNKILFTYKYFISIPLKMVGDIKLTNLNLNSLYSN
jgi:hypothetical protein